MNTKAYDKNNPLYLLPDGSLVPHEHRKGLHELKPKVAHFRYVADANFFRHPGRVKELYDKYLENQKTAQ